MMGLFGSNKEHLLRKKNAVSQEIGELQDEQNKELASIRAEIQSIDVRRRIGKRREGSTPSAEDLFIEEHLSRVSKHERREISLGQKIIKKVEEHNRLTRELRRT